MTDELSPPAEATEPLATAAPAPTTPPGGPPPMPPQRTTSPTGDGSDSGIWILVAGVGMVAIVVALLFRAFVNPVPVAAPSSSPTPAANVEPSPSPSPSASHSPSPPPTASPSPSPTASPSASVAPSASPTGAPTPTSGPTAAQTVSCDQPDTGVKVVYPADWYTVDEPPQYACSFFDSAPIAIPPDQTFPDAPVAVLADETPYQEALDALTDPTKWDVLSQSTTVSGLPATVAQASWIGKAPYTVGTQRYFYLVDRGAQGSVLFVTQGMAGDAYDQDKQVVDLMASNSTITATR